MFVKIGDILHNWSFIELGMELSFYLHIHHNAILHTNGLEAFWKKEKEGVPGNVRASHQA
jgi:hypothetical protein